MNPKNKRTLFLTSTICIILSIVAFALSHMGEASNENYILLYVIAVLLNIVLNLALSIKIASPILTGVGMPAWKAAKMRVFFKTQECHWFRLKRYLCSQRLFVSVQQKDPVWGLFARYSAAYPYSNRCLPIMQLLFGHLMTAAKNPPRRSHLRSGRRFRCPTHPQPASWPPPNLRPRSGPPSSGAQR